MIEFVSADRCTGCNICVAVCPTNVFDATPDGPPVIARQGSCQTCFMCELYCPVDALFVAHDSEKPVPVDARVLEEGSLLGSYRRAIGWTPETRANRKVDHSFKLTTPH
ncbi:MAG TPA: ferredoxin family protein [Stellaceae bacterium]|jgi:NAD-dependent dihydropyrimidine dehydrogenase PreA subunit|nr:ferredoxin family protein [Stellaceae bacterium]